MAGSEVRGRLAGIPANAIQRNGPDFKHETSFGFTSTLAMPVSKF
jgi:tetrahydromethanopterin S-methyltransferase subunit A